jgi:putative hydrolase of the HAD superfamily
LPSHFDASGAADAQVLVFDADDTLWENNVVFERVIDAFLDWLAHPTLPRPRLRGVLDDVERANTAVHGYGASSFLRSLADCAHRVRDRAPTSQDLAHIRELATPLLDHEIELIPDVADTLAALARRHDLLLLTKGDQEEQQRKIDNSRLAHHFRETVIVREKDTATYHEFIARHALPPGRSWMIGNSPKSDILPAREAGLNAVFIPNPHTWVLEHGELDPADERVLRLREFRELTDHF